MNPENHARSNRHVPTLGPVLSLLVLAAMVAVAGTLLWYLSAFFHDDAFITLRYATNLRLGLGPVWNPGELVEGYTSPLWVLLCAALSDLGIGMTDAPRVLGLLSLVGLLVAVWRVPGPAGPIASLLLAGNGAVIAWSLGGLETVGFALFLALGLLPIARAVEEGGRRSLLHAGLALALAYLCRPEGLLFFAVAGLGLVVHWCVLGRPAPRDIAIFGVPPTITIVTHLVWRRGFYGEWLPNTYFVKVGGESGFLGFGLEYLARFALFQAPVFLLLIYHLWMHRLSRASWWILAPVGIYIAYVCTTGDHMQWYRLLVPVLPFLYVLALAPLFERTPNGGWGTVAVLIFALFAWNLGATVYHGERGWKLRDAAAYHGTLAGLYIDEHWPRDSLVALNTAGSTAFYSRRRCLDMLGLNDKHIARSHPRPDPGLPWTQIPGHRKGDGRYVLSRRPDFIILGGSEGYTKPWFHSDKEIVEDPEFTRFYRLEAVEVPARDGIDGFVFRYFRRTANSEVRLGDVGSRHAE